MWMVGIGAQFKPHSDQQNISTIIIIQESITPKQPMKTITLSPQSLHPTKPQQQTQYTRSRILSNNIRNVELASINKISDIVNKSKFRDSGHIFYLRFQRKGKTRAMWEIKAGQPDGHTQRQPAGLVFGKVQGKDENMHKDMTEEPQNNTRDKLYASNPQESPRTLHLYQKQSLNTQLQFFKLYNRQQKSKTVNKPLDFNTQLIGTQKTFYHKIKPLSFTKRSISVNARQKIKDNTETTTKIKQLSQAQSKNKIKLEPISPGMTKKIIEGRNKNPYFQPWSYGGDEHEAYHY